MANFFANLPAYRDPGGLDFAPLNQAVQNFGETSRANAMAEYAAQRNKVADARAGRAEGRAQAKFNEEKGKEALNQLAGVYQAIEAAPEAERGGMLQRAMPMYQRLRQTIPDFDQDFAGLGADPNDFMTVGKLIAGRVRGPVDPLAQQKTQADIAKTEAETKWYNERPRTMIGGATTQLVDRLMAENPSMTLEEAITVAKRGSGVTQIGDELINRNSGAPVRNVGPAIANKASQEAQGDVQGKQIAAAPNDIAAADIALDLVNQLRRDPNRGAGTGFSSVFNWVPASPGYDYQNKVDQSKSGAFLTAIQQMRGLGALSNAEGQTATQAVTRMDTATSEQAFLAALSDYEGVVKKGRERASKRLQAPTDQPQAAPAKGVWSIQKVD
jgi:hypothetical protein